VLPALLGPFLVGKLLGLCAASDTRLERALDRLPGEIKRARNEAVVEEKPRLLKTEFRESLKISPVHWP